MWHDNHKGWMSIVCNIDLGILYNSHNNDVG